VPDSRVPRPRRFLVCEPRHFAVQYAINPWMHPDTPVDVDLARGQWQALISAYRAHGHTVDAVEPVAGLPDMVFAANSALVLAGRVFGSLFHAPQRRPESTAYQTWFKAAGFDVYRPESVCEGEGDLVPTGRYVLAGTGFRTTPDAHREVQEFFGVPVISLHLVDPRFYHLDTALAVLADDAVAYHPGAFSVSSRRVLEQLFPDAVLADETDALAFGLNLVSDGRNILLPAEAIGMADRLAAAGYQPVPVELSELKKGGGSVKCCVAELRR
jgi:N-dimethylarginine dimethylaminohydrolase